MTAYRIYRVDDDRLVLGVKVIEARTDEDALAAAAESLKERDLEIWTGTRQVGVLTVRSDAEEDRR